jgi:glycosyltransferase involved in cell wall biosynthesis
MAELFRGSQIAISPSTHDGTPNTLLEAMASGCFPIAGDIESLREWITSGVNGLLVDPGDPAALAKAILLALRDPEMRRRAAQSNRELIRQRAEYHHVMRQAEKFYRQVAGT